jgi:hypothetical protein
LGKGAVTKFQHGNILIQLVEHLCSVGACLATTSVDDPCVEFDVPMGLGTKITVFLDMLPLRLVAQYEGFGGTCCFQLQVSEMIRTKRHSIATQRVFVVAIAQSV